MTNTNNFSQKTNFTAGSNSLELLPFYLTSLNIPGINFSHVEVPYKNGSLINFTGDSVVYNTLSIEALVDEDFKIYHEIMSKINENVDVESGQFSNVEFDFWIQINNNKGNTLFKLEFYNCRIESIGDIQLDTQDDMTEFTMPIEIKFDYFKNSNLVSIPSLRT